MRCMIVDDHPLTRDGTALALRKADPKIEIFEADSLEQALDILARNALVDLVLLDLDLGDSKGLTTLSALKAWCELNDIDIRVVVLSGRCEPDLVREVVNTYATGYILKATSQEIFQCAIALTIAGGVYIPEIILKSMTTMDPALHAGRGKRDMELTRREREVASLLIQGLTYKKIARELERVDAKPVSEHTVRAHVGNIGWKLGVTENAKSGVMAEIARRRLTFPPVARQTRS